MESDLAVDPIASTPGHMWPAYSDSMRGKWCTVAVKVHIFTHIFTLTSLFVLQEPWTGKPHGVGSWCGSDCKYSGAYVAGVFRFYAR